MVTGAEISEGVSRQLRPAERRGHDRFHHLTSCLEPVKTFIVKLPRGERADLGSKLEEYVLNPMHREGRHKARVFESALGITLVNRESLRQAILAAAANSDQAQLHGDNGHGVVYSLRFRMETPKGSAVVLTAWIGRHGEDFPRMTTCYIV